MSGFEKKTFGAEPITGAAMDTLWCMFLHGPTWDGDLPSKTGRTWLVEKGYADREDGWNWLTRDGVTLALGIGLGRKKETHGRR